MKNNSFKVVAGTLFLIVVAAYVNIKKRSARQIVHFRLFDGHKHPEKDLKEIPFIDWAVLE